MKKYIIMALLLLSLSSCTRGEDFLIDLNEETEAIHVVEEGIAVIINKNSRSFHLDSACPYLSRMREENRMEITVESTETLLSHGYHACDGCAKITESDILS